jgi:hypothetical protein
MVTPISNPKRSMATDSNNVGGDVDNGGGNDGGGDDGGEGITTASTTAIENWERDTLDPRSFLSLDLERDGVVGWGSGVRGLVGMELVKNRGCDFKTKALHFCDVLTYWIWILINENN